LVNFLRLKAYYIYWGGLRLDTNRLDTSHSQRLNNGKPLGTGRCGWWYPIETWSIGILPIYCRLGL